MLKTEQDMATYLTLVIEENDVSELSHALGIAARARGMTEIAKASGLTREALYKALRPPTRVLTPSAGCRVPGAGCRALGAGRWALGAGRWGAAGGAGGLKLP